MAVKRDTTVAAIAAALGLAVGALSLGGRPVEQEAPKASTVVPAGALVDVLPTARVVDGKDGEAPTASIDRVDHDGRVFESPKYSPQYVADALAACAAAQREVGGGYVAPKRARWEALRAAFAEQGVKLPPAAGP